MKYSAYVNESADSREAPSVHLRIGDGAIVEGRGLSGAVVKKETLSYLYLICSALFMAEVMNVGSAHRSINELGSGGGVMAQAIANIPNNGKNTARIVVELERSFG